MRIPFSSFVAMLSVLLYLVLFSVEAHANVENANVLDGILRRYQGAATAWAATITARASWLFWLLVVISMVWTFGIMAVRRADLGEFFAEFIRFTVFTGFFWWLLINGPAFATSIIASLKQIGIEASGLRGMGSPTDIVDIGFDIFYRALDASSLRTPLDSMTGIILSAVILIILALISVNMLLLLVSGWILAYAGIFFLGFGGKTVLGVAVSLFAMVLLVGIGKTFLDDYYLRMSGGLNLKELSVMMVISIVLLVLVNKIPPMLSGIVGGGGGGGIGNIGGGAANSISLLNLLSLIREMDGNAPDVRFEDWRPGDQRYYVSDTRKFQAATGWTPTVDAPRGIARLGRWLRENRNMPHRKLVREEVAA